MVHIGTFIEVGLSQFYIEYSFSNIHVWSCSFSTVDLQVMFPS